MIIISRFYPHPLDQSLNNVRGWPTTRGIPKCSELPNRGGGYYIHLIYGWTRTNVCPHATLIDTLIVFDTLVDTQVGVVLWRLTVLYDRIN